ncbi:MAG: hypothetical protein K6U74_02945 [Firmicutes bacterium]|nr:hypothetical protein [Bacillota bacterium]
MIKVGDVVKWKSQAGGIEKEKQGIVVAFVPKGTRGAYKVLAKVLGIETNNLPKSRIKFQDINIAYDRAIVEVRRGGKSKVADYYAPSVNLLRIVDYAAENTSHFNGGDERQ